MADDPINGETEKSPQHVRRALSAHGSESEGEDQDDNDVRGHQKTGEGQMGTQAEKSADDDDVEGLRKRKV
jgi:hypothetical protein